jgi:MFS family permease
MGIKIMDTGTAGTSPTPPRLGLRENWAQFSLLVLVNAFVGGMVGLERTILPALAEEEFAVVAHAAILSFIVAFGIAKAATNYLTGRLADAYGRKPVLVGGWLVALPVPLLLMWAPSWGWGIAANVLLGVSQGLTWSATVIMKIDLAGPRQRGLAMGLNEFAGYVAVGGAALASGVIAANYGLRPAPFLLGLAFASIGLLLSILLVKETQGHVQVEAAAVEGEDPALSPGEVFRRASFADRDLSSASQAGFVNNLNDGMAWGLFPMVYAASGLGLAQIGWVAAAYPTVWGLGQLITGPLSDRIGRKGLIVGGMWVQALGIVLTAMASGIGGFAVAAVLMGIGTAMVYPTLLAVIGDVAHPTWRAGAVGTYRLWRDSGYAAGALAAGLMADALGAPFAIAAVAALTFASGLSVLMRMKETRPPAS